MPQKVICISAKCSDLFDASLIEKDGDIETELGEHYSGYVPTFFPGQHYGDYVMLDIDVETGKILNWKKPTDKQLKETFKT
jgi:hypothetical protein